MTATTHLQTRSRQGLLRSDWSGLALIAIAFVAMGFFYWDGIVAMVHSWAQPEYSFGPLVPIVSAYMLLHEMKIKPPLAEGGSRLPGLLVLAIAIAVGFVGNLTQIPHLIAYGFIGAIGGLGLILAGIKQGIRYWPGWVHLLFMLPLPNFLYWHLSGYLQRLSSHIGVEVIGAIGIPVFLDGNIIDLGIYKLQVVEACSGLRYLFPLMSFGYLFAVLYRGPLWQKLTLFLLTIPITILMNSFRIGVIGILVNYFGIGQAEGFLHLFEGWIIFIACTVILYIAGLVLQRLRKKPETVFNILSLDFDGIFKPVRELKRLKSTAAMIAAAGLIILGATAWNLAPSRPAPTILRESLVNFPLQLGNWKGQTQSLEDITVQALGADEYFLADYRSSHETGAVNLFISFYFNTSDGTGIHSPQICIPGSGWEVFRWQQVAVDPGSGTAPFVVNRALIQKGSERRLVYYWFEQRGRRLAGEFTTKLYTVWDSATKGRADGALVRLITPLSAGERENEGDRRLTEILNLASGTLPRFIPN